MAEKVRLVEDAGNDTALFIEVEGSSGNATIYPFKESALLIKVWKSIAFRSVFTIVPGILLSLFLVHSWSIYIEEDDGYAIIATFITAGLLAIIVSIQWSLMKVHKKDVRLSRVLMVREILREMRSNTSGEIESYQINSSFLHKGLDGDFITWYKQEKNRAKAHQS